MEIEKYLSSSKTETTLKVTISPTSGGGYCPKRAYLSTKKEVTSTISPVQEVYFEFGKMMENYLAGKLGDAVIGRNISLPANPEILATGELDILCLDENQKPHIIEVKTLNKFPSNTKKYKPDYYAQLMFYMAQYGYDGSIVYFGRKEIGDYYHGELNYRIEKFDFDLTEAKRIVFNYALTRWYIQKDITPPKPVALEYKARCGFCPFIDECWSQLDHRPYLSEAVDYSTEYVERFFSEEQRSYRLEDLYLKLKNKKITRRML